MKPDNWGEGYQAGLAGLSYDDNPHKAEPAGTAWAFGCSEGMKERNRLAFAGIMSALQEQASREKHGVTLARDPARPWFPETGESA